MSLDGKWANMAFGNLDALQISPEKMSPRNSLAWQFALLGLEKEAVAILENPPSYVLSMWGKNEDAILAAETHLAQNPNDFTTRNNMGLALASAGDYVRARPFLEEMWQRTGKRVVRNGFFGL